MIKPNRSLPFVSVFACAAAMLSPAAQPAEEISYEMTSYVDRPGGPELLDGHYQAAIAAASRRRAGEVHDALVAVTNLCVAYTVTQKFSLAEAACDDALTFAKRVDSRRYSGARKAAETAKALSNRGVLRAVSGAETEAARDFRQAADMNRAWNIPTRNLLRLEREPGLRLGMARSD